MQAREATTVELYADDQFSINLISEGETKRFVECSFEKKVVARFPLDSLDNTLAGVVDKEVLDLLGEHAMHVISLLLKVLPEKIGGKQIIVIPKMTSEEGKTNNEFVSPEFGKCDRLRHTQREQFTAGTEKILAKYPLLVEELDAQYQFAVGSEELEAGVVKTKRYEELREFLKVHADFLPSKISEYEDQQVPGMRVRFTNENVTPMALLHKDNKKVLGTFRVLPMGSNHAYLSDEAVDQSILPLEAFLGDTQKEQEDNRRQFLLAYLMNKACKHVLNQQESLIIIAADGKVPIYESLGFEKFPRPQHDYVILMNFSAAQPALKNTREQLILNAKKQDEISLAALVSKMGVIGSPSSQRREVVAPTPTVEVKKQGLGM